MDRNWHTITWRYNKHQLYPVTFIHESVIRGLSRKVKRHTCTVLGALQKTCKTDRLADREKTRNALIAYEKRTGSRPSPLLSSKGVFLFDDIVHKSEKLLSTTSRCRHVGLDPVPDSLNWTVWRGSGVEWRDCWCPVFMFQHGGRTWQIAKDPNIGCWYSNGRYKDLAKNAPARCCHRCHSWQPGCDRFLRRVYWGPVSCQRKCVPHLRSRACRYWWNILFAVFGKDRCNLSSMFSESRRNHIE